MGPGSGKTTLAKKLELLYPNVCHRVVQLTTREKRVEETEGDDYFYITKDELYNLKNSGKLFETVENQFAPNVYGAEWRLLDNNKFNIVVVSIEGFLSAMKSVQGDDSAILINILVDDILDIEREDRNAKSEENINKGVLYQFLNEHRNKIVIPYLNSKCSYVEISLSELKEVRDNENALRNFLESINI